MKPYALSLRSIAISVAAGVLLAACGSAAEEATPTFTVEQIQTEAVATFSAGLTETALAMPTSTPTPTETPSPTPTTTPVVTSTVVAVVTFAPATCEGLAFVSDVTIPDNTTMTPGQQFTKTWRVRNNGTCPWQTSFKLNFTGGEKMGGSTGSIANAVPTGNEVNISVPMTAPATAGTYRGNWRMTNASGTFFGDEIYLVIVVSGTAATSTPTKPAATATLAPATATPTPTLAPTETETPTS